MGFTAIFGGTFNPLHIGHYEMLAALQKDPAVDEIFIMPDRIPPHKVCDRMASDNARIEMCKIAAKDFSKAQVCLIEFERTGKSYSYDTVLQLKAKYPQKEFAFVCGGDMLVYFTKWYKYQELMKLLPFIVFKRSDTNNIEFDTCVNNFRNTGMSIIVKDEVIPAVSSTQIRNDFKGSKLLLPQNIYEYLISGSEYVE